MEPVSNIVGYHSSALRFLGPRAGFAFYAAKFRADRIQKCIGVRAKDVPCEVLIRTNTSDLKVLMQIFVEKEYDFSKWLPYRSYIEGACAQIIKEGHTPLIIDAGANIGASSIWFALNFPSCQIFAVEPDADNFAMLKRNVEYFSNVKVFNAGLWDKRTDLSIVNPTQGAWARRVEENSSAATISSITVPDLLGRDEKLRLLIVKIDIEGGETQLLRSQTEWIDSVPLVVFEAHDNIWKWLGPWQGSGHSFYSVLSRRKREYLSKGENMFAFLHPQSEICSPSPE